MEDGAISRTLHPSESLALTKYNIAITTSEEKGSGTDANVFIILFGEKVCVYDPFLLKTAYLNHFNQGDSGVKKLDNSKNNFERGSTDNFVLQCANLGNCTHVKLIKLTK